MRRHFLKSLGRLFVFMRKSSKFIPYLSAADARIGTGACSCASSGAAEANHSCLRIILVIVVCLKGAGAIGKGEGEIAIGRLSCLAMQEGLSSAHHLSEKGWRCHVESLNADVLPLQTL